MGKNLFDWVSTTIRDLFNSFSIITLLLIASSILILGTDFIYDNFPSTGRSPPRILEPGVIVEQTVAVGRGQTLVLEAQSNDSLMLRIISGHSIKGYQNNPRPEFMLYFREGSTFFFEEKFNNYTIIYIFWDNSPSINTILISNANLSVFGLDLDLITVSMFFLIIGIIYEVFINFIRIFLKKEPIRFPKQYLISSLSSIQTGNKFPSHSRMAFILFRKECTIFPSNILFGLLLARINLIL